MQEVELFFNAGDIELQVNWLIYPKSLSPAERQELLSIVDGTLTDIFVRECVKRHEEVESVIDAKCSYPDPTKLKSTTSWFYHQMARGAVVYRFGFDGRRESDTKRINSSIEGAYLDGVDLSRSIRKYGPGIIEEIGNCLPDNIEKMLVAQNFDIFEKMYRDYEVRGELKSLYNHFYVACQGREIEITTNISTRPLCRLSTFGKWLNRK